MRILCWTDWYLPSIGGVEVFLGRLLPALARRGHWITVVAGHHRAGLPDVTEVSGVTIRRFRFHPVLAANDAELMSETLLRIVRLKRELAPDLVHLNTLGPSVLFHLGSARRCPAPVLLTMHSPVMEEAGRPDTLYGQALDSATWINCNSHAVRADLCGRLPHLRDRSSVTYYGMDPPALEPSPRPRDEPRILGYGRMVTDKGFDLAILAFAAVLQRYPRARLTLAGEGAAVPELQRLAQRCGIASSVDFVGPVRPDQVPALLDRASLVVVPSRWEEPFGLVALEAALVARPVIAARAGGLAEVVEHGTTGLLVDKEDPEGLAQAILRLLDQPDQADRLGLQGRARAGRRFGWERCIDEYERLYHQSRRTPRALEPI